MNLRFFLLLPLLLLSRQAAAIKDYYARFNTDTFWQKLVLESPDHPIALSARDTVIVVVSNRATWPDSLRFMSEDRGDGTLRYYVVYTRAGKWRVHPYPGLREALRMIPADGKDWVVYTEGMGKIFTTDLDRGIDLAGQYRVNVLLLDYPSIHSGLSGYRNYRFAYKSACAIYTDFMPVLDSLKRIRTQSSTPDDGHLTLLFHSMGNNLIREIVQHDLLAPYNDRQWVDNIILNAPCVPRRHSRKWMEKIHFAGNVVKNSWWLGLNKVEF